MQDCKHGEGLDDRHQIFQWPTQNANLVCVADSRQQAQSPQRRKDINNDDRLDILAADQGGCPEDANGADQGYYSPESAHYHDVKDGKDCELQQVRS